MSQRPPFLAAIEAGLFEVSRPLLLWGRFDPQQPRVWPRALAVAAAGWLPLPLLALGSLAEGHPALWQAFWQDTSVHTRSLVVAPLLVFAEALCLPRLAAIAQSFRARGVVPPRQMRAYESIVDSVRRLSGWRPAEVIAMVLAASMSLLLVRSAPASFLPDWHHGGTLGRSLASWWNALVSLPLLLTLLAGWAWRLLLWSRYLWLVSRLELRLVASHPEGAAGLLFVGYSLRAWSPLGLVAGLCVASATLAHLLAGHAVDVQQLSQFAFMTVVAVELVFVAPLLVFVGPLLHTWRNAVDSYGALAQRVGGELEDRWMRAGAAATAQPLESPDFSATADLYQVVEKACTLRLVPIELRSVFALACVTLSPFVAVALALAPFDQLLQALLGLFL